MERIGLAKTLVSALVAVSFLCATSNAHAQEVENSEDRLLPTWKECLVDDERHACFGLEETKALLVLESKAISWKKKISLYKDQIETLDLIINIKEDHIQELKSTVQLYEKRNEELTNQLLEEIAEKNDYKAKADSRPFLPWLITGLVVALSAAFGAGIYVAKR